MQSFGVGAALESRAVEIYLFSEVSNKKLKYCVKNLAQFI